MTKRQYAKALYTIALTAVAHLMRGGDGVEDILAQCEHTACAIQEQFGLDASVMDAYHHLIHAFEVGNISDKVWNSMTLQAAEHAKSVIYALCDRLKDPREIMRHVRTADKLVYTWQPNRSMVDRQTGEDYWEAFMDDMSKTYQKGEWPFFPRGHRE